MRRCSPISSTTLASHRRAATSLSRPFPAHLRAAGAKRSVRAHGGHLARGLRRSRPSHGRAGGCHRQCVGRTTSWQRGPVGLLDPSAVERSQVLFARRPCAATPRRGGERLWCSWRAPPPPSRLGVGEEHIVVGLRDPSEVAVREVLGRCIAWEPLGEGAAHVAGKLGLLARGRSLPCAGVLARREGGGRRASFVVVVSGCSGCSSSAGGTSCASASERLQQ